MGKQQKVIRSAYDGSRVEVLCGGGESMTRQEFESDCDINTIMERYITTGQIPPQGRTPVFQDVSEMVDLKTSIDRIAAIQERLPELPRSARELFEQDSRTFMENLENVETVDDLRKLGILAAESAEEAQEVATEPIAPVELPREGGVSQDS